MRHRFVSNLLTTNSLEAIGSAAKLVRCYSPLNTFFIKEKVATIAQHRLEKGFQHKLHHKVSDAVL